MDGSLEREQGEQALQAEVQAVGSKKEHEIPKDVMNLVR